jgi:hypothetical protein
MHESLDMVDGRSDGKLKRRYRAMLPTILGIVIVLLFVIFFAALWLLNALIELWCHLRRLYRNSLEKT